VRGAGREGDCYKGVCPMGLSCFEFYPRRVKGQENADTERGFHKKTSWNYFFKTKFPFPILDELVKSPI
jgi:hypothetical protein